MENSLEEAKLIQSIETNDKLEKIGKDTEASLLIQSEVKDAIDGLKAPLDAIVANTIQEKPEVQQVELKGISVITLKGDKGDKPTKEEITSLIEPLIPSESDLKAIIEPLIPEPMKGDNGEDYVLTNADKSEIASLIEVPIVEKVIEKTETIIEKPITIDKTKTVIKEVAKYETPNEIADKLNTLSKEIDFKVIKNFPDFSKNGGSGLNTVFVDNVTVFGNGLADNPLRSVGGGASPLTTKGDLYTFTTVDARLPVGTNGQVLSANSATATGLEWIAAPTGLTLQTNGITNGSQTLFNAQSTGPLGITDDGFGNILWSIQIANAVTTGAISSTDWNTFNSKVSSQWVTSGSNIYYSTGNVGIGNTSPTTKLDVTGVLTLSGATAQIVTNTTDGSDNQELAFSAANALGVDRGAFFALEGNEVATIGGSILFGAGNVSTGNIDFYTGNYINRMRVANGGQVSIGNTATNSKFNVYSATGAIQRLETGTSTLDLDFISTVGQGAIGINSDAIYIQALDSLSNGIYFWMNTAGQNSLHLLATGHIRHDYSPSIYMDTYVTSAGNTEFTNTGSKYNFDKDIYTDVGLYIDTGNIAFSPTGTGGGSSLTIQTSANNRTIEFSTKIAGSQAVRLAILTTGVEIFDTLTLSAHDIATDTTTGMKIATGNTQKIGFWNATPIVQPTTAVTAGAFVANTSGIVDDSATFDGYTIGQIAAALRAAGLLA